MARYYRSKNFIKLATISFRASWGKASTRVEQETVGEEAEGDTASPAQPQRAALPQDPGLTWVLKVFLELAQLSHLDHERDAWDQTTE